MAELAPITVEGEAPAPAPAPVAAYRPLPGLVTVTNRDGSIDNVREEDLAQAQAEGSHLTTQVEQYTHKTGAAGTAMAAAMGVGRGLSFGLTDKASVEAERLLDGDKGADEMREHLRLLKEGHQTASIVGEIGGSLLPLALGIGPGAGAVEAGGSLLARAGARAVAAAPRAFLEGALIAEGQQLTEDTLGNHELVASKYLAKGVEGGLLGMLMGSAFSAGGGVIADKLAGRAARAATGTEGAVYRSLGERAEAGAAKPLMSRVSELAEEQAVKGVLPSASLSGSELQKLGSTAEAQMDRARRIGRTLLDEGITTAGASKAIQAERLTGRVKEVGAELSGLRAALEKSAVRPNAEGVMARIQAEVLEPLAATPFTGDVQSALKPIVEEIGALTKGKATFETFEDLFKMRSALDKKLAWTRGIPPPTPALKELRAVRGILEDEFESAAARAAGDLGEDVAQKYRVTKALFSDLKQAQTWATKAAARGSQNQAISLTDMIAGGGSFVGNVVQGNVLGAVGDLAGLATNKLRREFGNQAAAVVLDRASRIQMLQRAAEAFDTKLSGSVKSFFTGTKAAGGAARTTSKVSPEARQALRAAVSSPEALTQRVGEQLAAAGIREAAPRVTDAAVSTIMRAAAYVQNRLPPEPRPAGLSFGQQKPRAIGLRAQAELDNAVRALDVDKTLDDFAKGRLDRQAWTALRIINPPLFQDMVGQIQKYATENQPTMDRQKLVALSIVTGESLTPYMEPKTVRGLQQAYATPGPAGPPANPTQPGVTEPKPMGDGGGGSSGGTSRAARAFASGSDKMEASDDSL